MRKSTDWFPPPEEFIEALAVSWLRVGYEALGLLAYVVKQNDESDVSDDEEGPSTCHCGGPSDCECGYDATCSCNQS